MTMFSSAFPAFVKGRTIPFYSFPSPHTASKRHKIASLSRAVGEGGSQKNKERNQTTSRAKATQKEELNARGGAAEDNINANTSCRGTVPCPFWAVVVPFTHFVLLSGSPFGGMLHPLLMQLLPLAAGPPEVLLSHLSSTTLPVLLVMHDGAGYRMRGSKVLAL